MIYLNDLYDICETKKSIGKVKENIIEHRKVSKFLKTSIYDKGVSDRVRNLFTRMHYKHQMPLRGAWEGDAGKVIKNAIENKE